MNSIEEILGKLGLSEKEVKIYISLLSLGQSPIRKIAEKSGINRGTTHIILRELQSLGLVSYYHKERNQHFVAEDPKILSKIFSRKKTEIENAEKELENIIPKLYSLSKTTSRPVVKFYENYSGIKTILEDALDSTEKSPEKKYCAFSSSAISPFLYDKKAFPDFTEERIRRNIHVRTIACGPGGKLSGNDERKWLERKTCPPTYKLVYANKVAMISLGANNKPHGLIIEDQGLYETELFVFDSLWKTLK